MEIYQQEEKVWEQKDHRTGGEEPMADGDGASDSKQFEQLAIGQEMQEVRVTDHWPSSTKSVCLISPEWL